MSTAWTLLCHRLGRQDEQQLRSEAAQSLDATDQDVRRRLAELLPDERVRLTLRTAAADDDSSSDGGLTGAHLLADLGLALTLQQVLLSAASADGVASPRCVADAKGRTPLHWAARAGHWEACRVLLNHGGCCMTALDSSGRTPLDLAAAGGHAKLLEVAFELNDAWRQFLSRQRDFKGRTALHAACRAKSADNGANGGAKVLALLLSRLEAPGKLARQRDEARGWPPGFYAARHGDVACMRLLAGRPDTLLAALLDRAEDGRSLLHAAAQGGSVEAFDFGVGLGLDPTTMTADKGETPAHDCARAGHAELLKRLLEGDTAGDLIGSVELRCGQSLLHCAAESNSLTAVRALVEAGHPLDSLDDWGRTPAESARVVGNHEVAEELEVAAESAAMTPRLHAAVLESADDPEAEAVAEVLKSLVEGDELHRQLWQRDGTGWTAAHVAAGAANLGALARLLTEEPRLLKALTPRRETLLHAALKGDGDEGREATVKQLLDRGIRPDVVDIEGDSPLRLAARRGLARAFDAISTACGGLRSTCILSRSEQVGSASKLRRGGLLHLAAAGGSVDIVRRLLALHIPALDPFLARDSRGRLPVHWAARAGSADCLALLLRQEIAAGRAAPQPPSLHHLAMRSGSEKAVSVLEQLLVPVLRFDNRGRSLLHSAAAGGSENLVRGLLNRPAPLQQSVTGADNRGATPAHAAASAGRADIIRLLLDQNKSAAEKLLMARCDSPGSETLLHAAARGGCIETARLLIERSDGKLSLDADEIKVDEKSRSRESPAHAAARAGQSGLLSELVLSRPEAPLQGLIHAAAEAGQAETVSLLLNSGRCCPFERDPVTGRTAAHCAAASGDPRTLRTVLAFDRDGALAKSTDSAGRSLLHSAVELQAPKLTAQQHVIVRRLLRLDGEAGHPLTPDADGRTPVDLAVLSGAAPALAVLLRAVTEEFKPAKALSELENLEGRGLLHSACLTGRADTVLLLVAMGLSPWQRDANGLPAVSYAAAASSPDALSALLSAAPAGGPGLLAARAATDGATLAHVAAHANRPASLRLLAGAGLPVLDALDTDGWSPLQVAISAEAWDAVEALVDEAVSQVEAAVRAEADPAVECPAAASIPDMRTPDGRSLLHLAAAVGNSGVSIGVLCIARLTDSSTSTTSLASRHSTLPVFVTDSLGWTPLHEALLAGRAELARLLLGLSPSPVKSASPSSSKVAGGFTCLHLAVLGCCRCHGNTDAVKMCLEFWPWQAWVRDDEGFMPIHLAAMHGSESAVRVLLDASVFHLHTLTTDGNTPLHLASSEPVVRQLSNRLLIKDRTRRNRCLRLPSEEALARGRPESLVKLLRNLEIQACEDRSGLSLKPL